MGNLFLTMTGVTGESLDAHLEGSIEIHEWSWSVANAAPYGLKEADATTHASSGILTIHKMVDRATVSLVKLCAHGNEIPEAKIICRKLDEDGPVQYLTIEFDQVKVRSVNWAGRNEEVRGIPEQVVLDFKKFTIAYRMQMSIGLLERDSDAKGPIEFAFDIPQQKAQPAKPTK